MQMILIEMSVSPIIKILRMHRQDYDNFMKHCHQVKKLSDNRSLLKIIETQELIVAKKLEHVEQDLISVLAQQKEIMHEHLESIIDYFQVSHDSVVVFTEYSTHNLAEEVAARKKSNTLFSLEELENIMLSVLKALQYLESKQIGHGCLSLQDIVISSNGTIKLMDPCLATNSPFNPQTSYFYSPQLLSYNEYPPSSQNLLSFSGEYPDMFKNDLFVLAMLILQLGLLDSSVHVCCDLSKGAFDYNVLDGFLNSFMSRYQSQSVIELMCAMLQEDVDARITVEGALVFAEERFGEGDDLDGDADSDGADSSEYLYESKGKTVKSFLLSQGPISSIEESMRSSRESELRNQGKGIFTGAGTRNGRQSLIKC